PDLMRSQHLVRPEGENKVGGSFALRATVAYMGTWVRYGRTFTRDGAANHMARAATQFSSAVSQLPNPRGFETFPHWLMEGCLTTQPLAPIMGSRVAAGRKPAAGALVSLQAHIAVEDQTIFLAAPALINAGGAGAKLLVDL